MKVGERIRRIRKFRGMTLKQLGIALGNPEKTADIRISQYESGKRNPTEESLLQMSKALRCDSRALGPHDHDTEVGLMYTLFDLEDTYGLHIDQIDGELVIRMDKYHQKYLSIFDQFLEWYEAWKQDQTDDDPVAYTEWKINYPPKINRKK